MKLNTPEKAKMVEKLVVKKLPFEEYKAIYCKVPKFSVDVLIQTSEGILLTKRTIEPAIGEWHIPGGAVLKGENLEKAARRIAREELAVEIKIEELLGVIEYDFPEHWSQDIALVYSAKIISGKVELDSDAEEFGFFKVLPKNMIASQRDFITKNLKNL